MSAPYLHGYHPSVVAAHGTRTAANSCGYLQPHLASGMTVLDVGCGPGSITLDLAEIVAPGQVIGIDGADTVLDMARTAADARGDRSTRFETADAYQLPYADASFDVVHAHQVLHHLTDPVAALVEMGRVARPGGLIGVRETDFGAYTWYPESPGLDRWLATFRDMGHAHGTEPDAGRRLLAWAHAAGYDDVTASASVWCYTTPQDRAWWAGSWAERVVASTFADQARAYGLTDPELAGLADAWRSWGEEPDGWFALLHGEILVRIP